MCSEESKGGSQCRRVMSEEQTLENRRRREGRHWGVVEASEMAMNVIVCGVVDLQGNHLKFQGIT